jgi:hypothetical protein
LGFLVRSMVSMSMATVACKGIYDSLVYLNSLVSYNSRSNIATLLTSRLGPKDARSDGHPSCAQDLPSSTSPGLLLHTPLLSSLRLGPSRNNKSRWRRPRLLHPTSTALPCMLLCFAPSPSMSLTCRLIQCVSAMPKGQGSLPRLAPPGPLQPVYSTRYRLRLHST